MWVEKIIKIVSPTYFLISPNHISQIMSTKFFKITDEYVQVKVIMSTKDLIPSARNCTHFVINHFHRVHETLKNEYDVSLSSYPDYVTQTGRFHVVPFGRKPYIDPKFLQMQHIEEEQGENDENQKGKQVDDNQVDSSQPMEVGYADETFIYDLTQDDNEDNVIML